MISIKRYGYIVNRQFKVNKKRNLSIISGIILSIILFTIVGYIQDYYVKTNLLNAKNTLGNYEAIIMDISKDKLDKLKNNILVNNVGVYSLLDTLSIGDNEVSLYVADDITLKEMFSSEEKLIEGSLPKNENEIMLDSSGKNFFNKTIGESINFNGKDYKIVGIYNKSDSMNLYDIDLVTHTGEIKNLKHINAAFNVNSEKNKDKVIEKVLRDLGIEYKEYDIVDKVIINKRLIYLYSSMNMISKEQGEPIRFRVDLIYYFVILILSIILTYNSINVSIKERINQFSILRCIGASTSKIKMLLIKESFFLALYSIIPGVILGQLICCFIVSGILNKLVNTNGYQVPYQINFKLIGVTVFLSIVNIAISTIIPVLKVGKISPIEGSKNNIYTNKKLKKIKSKKIRKYLGYNMEIAFKNIIGNYREFFLTTITSVVLLTIFIVSTGYSKSTIKHIQQEEIELNELYLNLSQEDNNNSLDLLKKHEENIKALGITENIFGSVDYYITGIFKDLQFNKYIKNNNHGSSIGHVNTTINNKKIGYSDGINFVIMNDKLLENVISKTQDDKLTKEDFKDNGVIITNTVVIKNIINTSKAPWLDLKKGEEFNLVVKNTENNEIDKNLEKDIKKTLSSGKEVKLKYLGTIDGDKLGYNDKPTLLVSEDFYNNNKELFIKENGKSYLTNYHINMFMDLNPNIDRSKAVRSISDYANNHRSYIIDNKSNNEYFKNNAILLYRLVNLIMLLIIMVGGTIMINNKIISINLRGKEIGTLLAIGISKKRIKKIFIFEGIIQWIISSVLSLSLSSIILKVMYELLIYNLSLNKGEIPLFEMIFGCIVLLIINILGSYIPIRKLKYINTTNLIRNNE